MFQLRKLNSLLVIIIILILASHALLTGLLLAGLIEYTPNTIVTGEILLFFVILHIIISLYLFIKDKIKQRKIHVYANINKDTIVQAISGIFIIIFIVAFGFLVEKNDYDKCRKVIRILLIIIFTLLFLTELSYYIL